MTILLDNGYDSDTPGKRSPDSTLLEYAWNREIDGHSIAGGRLRCFDVRDISLTLHRAAEATFYIGAAAPNPYAAQVAFQLC